MKKCSDDEVNQSKTWGIETVFLQSRKLFDDIDVIGIKGKQLDLCKGNMIFCHVDCLCLQEKRVKPEVFCDFIAWRPPQQS